MRARTLSFRRLEYKPHLIRWEEIEEESVTGKQYIYPAKCKKVCPCLEWTRASSALTVRRAHPFSMLTMLFITYLQGRPIVMMRPRYALRVRPL